MNKKRIAVIGAGPAGSSFATAVLAFARRQGSDLSLTLFDFSPDIGLPTPVLADREARRHLASLGISIFSYPGLLELEAIYLFSQGTTEQITLLPESMWVLDQFPQGPSGGQVIKQALLSRAQSEGAMVRPWRVDALEPKDRRYVVRARGKSEIFDMVVGAFGCSSTMASSWLKGHYLPPPLVPGAHARLRWSTPDKIMRLFLRPVPEIDLLLLLPTPRGEAYAWGTGQLISPQYLARALAILMRDGAIPGRLQASQMERFACSNGAARTMLRENEIGVGATSMGELWAPGLSWALADAIRCAQAVADTKQEEQLKNQCRKKRADLRQRAMRQAKILYWACRAGPKASHTLARYARLAQPLSPFQSPFSGIHDLDTKSVLWALRFDALQNTLGKTSPEQQQSITHQPPNPKLIFIVDDDADVRTMLLEFFQQQHIDARAFDNELSLLEAAARESPGTILLDIVLPWINGLALCHSLRHHPATSHAQLISMSSLGRPSDRQAAFMAEADAFLPKPIDLQQLMRMIADHSLPSI